MIRRLCSKVNGLQMTVVNKYTTHLIVGRSDQVDDDDVKEQDGDIFAQRTLKYLQVIFEN